MVKPARVVVDLAAVSVPGLCAFLLPHVITRLPQGKLPVLQ
jgi:hypothetical protein